MKLKNYSRLFSGLILAGCLIGLPAFAKASWSKPAQVSLLSSNDAHIAVDPSGKAFAIWQSFDGKSYVIQSSNLPQNGNWTGPVTLSKSGKTATHPSIAVDAKGNAICVWSEFNGEHFMINSALLSPEEQWSAPIALSTDGTNAVYSALASSKVGQGSTVAAWGEFNEAGNIIKASTLSPSGNWSTSVNVSSPEEFAVISEVAAAPRNYALVTYSSGTEDETVAHASFFNGNTWNEVPLPEGAKDHLSIAMDRKGNAVCVWPKFDLPTKKMVVYASFLSVGKAWSAPRLLSDPYQNAYSPKVRMNSNGNAIALWIGSEKAINSEMQVSDSFVYASISEFNLQWGAPQKLSNGGQYVSSLDLKVGPLGSAVAIWTAFSDESHSSVQAASLSKKGRWAKPKWSKQETISSPDKIASSPVVGIDRLGNAVALWLESDPEAPSEQRVWSAFLTEE